MQRLILLVGLEPSFSTTELRSLSEPASTLSMQVLGNAAQARELMQQPDLRAILAAPRLADMTGPQLLDLVRQQRPELHRFLYAYGPDLEELASAGAAHYLFLRPLETGALSQTIARADRLAGWFPIDRRHQVLTTLRRVPGPPCFYYQLLREMESPLVSVDHLASMVAAETQVSGTLVRLAHDPVLDLPRELGEADDVVRFLGPETAAALALLAHVCNQFERVSPSCVSMDAFCQHALGTARLARAIARSEHLPEDAIVEAFTAGLWHDVGKLILAARAPETYFRFQQEADWGLRPLAELELSWFGTTHAEVGAWLAAVWGLSLSVVGGIAFHHEPAPRSSEDLGLVDIVHAADLLDHHLRSPGRADDLPRINPWPMQRLAYEDRLPAWLALARTLLGRPAQPADGCSELLAA